MKVLRELGIQDDVASRVRAFANGAVAMRELAQSSGPGQLGCTQITEINYTPGVMVAGPLPVEFELATVYAAAVAAVAATAARRELALRFLRMLTGPESRELRERGGFEI